MGLFVRPDIPEKKVRNAIKDYARKVGRQDVHALYDATLLGSAKDGALFLSDRFVFQNNDLQPSHDILYEDVVDIELKKRMMGGRSIMLSINRGRATVQLEMDFSGKPKAAPFIERFLREAMHEITEMELSSHRASERSEAREQTDVRAVEEALIGLVKNGALTKDDYKKMMQILV